MELKNAGKNREMAREKLKGENTPHGDDSVCPRPLRIPLSGSISDSDCAAGRDGLRFEIAPEDSEERVSVPLL
jgi:hypothetical protein